MERGGPLPETLDRKIRVTIQSLLPAVENQIQPLFVANEAVREPEVPSPARDVAELAGTGSADAFETIGSADALPGQGTTERPALAFCSNCITSHGQASGKAEQGSGQTQGPEGAGPVTVAGEPVPDLHELAFGEESEGAETAPHEAGGGHLPGEEEAEGDVVVEDPSEQSITGETLTDEDQKEVERLRERDREVRAHEQAHAAAGGSHIRGGIKYEYTTGPDGRRYATGGEVSIDTSPVPGDPQKTIQKAQQIRRAAMAPAEPSGADRQAAAAASRMEAEARQELIEERANPEGADSETEPIGGAGESDDARAGTEATPDDDTTRARGDAAEDVGSTPRPGVVSDDAPGLAPIVETPSVPAPEDSSAVAPPELDPAEITEAIEDRVPEMDGAPAAKVVALSYAAAPGGLGGLLDVTS